MGGELVFLIPIVAILGGTAVIVAFSPLARALAARFGGKTGDDPQLLAALQEQADRLLVAEDAIEKLEQKVEFQERLLTGRPESDEPRERTSS